MAAKKSKKANKAKSAVSAKTVSVKKEAAPEAQLESFIDAFDAKDQKLIRALRAMILKRLPAVNELVYDYAAFFVIGYSPTDHGPDGIVSIAARANDVRFYVMGGPKLPDPKKLLKGKGSAARHVEIKTESQLKDPDIQALFEAAIDMSKFPLPAKGKGYIEVRSVAPKPPNRRK